MKLVLCLLLLAQAAATAAELRIITLGDSITKGVRPGVEPGQTFSDRMRQPDLEAAQLHGAREPGDEGPIIVDQHQRAVGGEFVGFECQIIFGHGCLQKQHYL